MEFSFWEDEISKKLEIKNKKLSLFWKISNLCWKLCIIVLVFGVILLLIAASSPETNNGILPIIALLLFITAGFMFMIYMVSVLSLMVMFNESPWAVVTFISWLISGIGFFLSLYYKYKKGKEIREGKF